MSTAHPFSTDGGVTSLIVLRVSPAVAAALADGRPVVALESTISSTLGLPVPYNAEVLDRCVAAIEAGGATAAITAVIDGVARVGVNPTSTTVFFRRRRSAPNETFPSPSPRDGMSA
jgi:pseudouridine-5'-phosphate glycosidase